MKGLIFSLFVLSWLIGFVWMLLYVRQLKKRHPKLHADIFRDPFQKKICNDWRLFVFLVSAKYRGSVDHGFGRQSEFLRYYIFMFFALMALTVYALATL